MIKVIQRVLRGGSWDVNPINLRASYRNWFDTDTRYGFIGFRLVVRIKGE